MNRLVNTILVTSSLFSSIAAFATEQESNTQLEKSATELQVTDRTNKFTPVILPFYDPSTDTGIMAVPLFAFYPDDEDLVSDASTIGVPIFYTSNGKLFDQGFC